MSIEEEFFKTFGIEKQKKYGCTDTWEVCHHDREYPNCKGCPFWELINTEYPKITSDILLELICILNTVTEPDLGDINYGRLRNSIIEQCIEAPTKVDWTDRSPTKEEFILDVQSLFKGGEQQ